MTEQDANKERLELALEAAGLDLWENDLLTGDVTRKSDKIFIELGYSKEEIASCMDSIFTIVHPDDIPMIKKTIDDHLTGAATQYRCEFRVRSKSGAWVWYANYGKIMDRDRDNRGRRFIGVTFNIDDRKHKEDELAVREQEVRTLIENSPDTIARYDRGGRRIYVNPAFGALTEGGMSALLGKTPTEMPGGANSEIYETKIRGVFATGENTQFELKWLGKGGEEICSHIRLTAERDSSGNIISVLGVGRDITELNESRAELKRKELTKTRFLAAAGHDLRQPLAAANLFIDALRHTELLPRQHEILTQLDLAMGSFNGLLDSLLNISKLDAGIIAPEYKSIKLSEIFDWLEQSFAPLAGEKKLGFRLHFPISNEIVIHADIDLLRSSLMNLVTNAIKYTPKGSILIGARRRGGNVLFQIWDTGIGIKTEHIKQIFDEFYQVNNPQRDRTSGLGLGLAIVKRALMLMGVEISCRSRIGRGSVFEFCLPLNYTLSAMMQHTPTMRSLEDKADDSFTKGKRFVVVEDDKLVVQAIARLLEGMGCEVKCFYNAEAALRDDHIEDADYYITDYMLGGGLNGIQFLNQLRQKKGKPIRAVLMTGDTSSTFLQDSATCDWPVLYKPTNISKLFTSLAAQ